MAVRKIVVVDINQFFGGGQVYGLQLAQMLLHSHDIRVICVNKRFAEELKQRKVPIVDMSNLLGLGRISHQILIAAWCVWLRLTGKADLIWLNGIPEIVIAPVCRLLGCKVVVTRHLTLQLEPQSRLKRIARVVAEIGFKYCAPFASKVICVSDAVRESMTSILPPAKLEVIHNWVSALPPRMEIAEANSDLCRLLYVGRVEKYKGAFTIIDAMRLLQNDLGSGKTSLTIVGQGNAKEAMVEAAQGLDVHLVGFQQEPAKFYANADVFINPSPGPEGLPLVTLDAMSHGLPCILSDLPVHLEVSEGGQSTLIFHAGDAADLAEKIKMLSASAVMRKQYGERARKTIEANFEFTGAREKYFRMIDSLG